MNYNNNYYNYNYYYYFDNDFVYILKEQYKNRIKEKKNKKALQLSGKIPALGAGGPGSIPGGAQFFKFLFFKKDNIKYKQKYK